MHTLSSVMIRTIGKHMDAMDVMGLLVMVCCFVPVVAIGIIGAITILIMDLLGLIRGEDKMEDICQNCKYRMPYNGEWVCMNEKSGAYKRPIKTTDYCGAFLWKGAKIKRP